MNTTETKKRRKDCFYWFKFYPSKWVNVLCMTESQAGKLFKQLVKRLIENKAPENSEEYEMIQEALKYNERQRTRMLEYWQRKRAEQYNDQETATTPQISTDGPRQAENEEAVATSPSCGGSAARISTDGDTREDSLNMHGGSNAVTLESATSVDQSYAHDALDSLDDKASDPNCGADAVNRKTTVDRKSPTSAPQQRRNPPPQCVIDAQKKADARKAAARSGKRVKPSKPKDREDFKQFVFEANLHIGIAEDWYALHEQRGWMFKDGTPIKDWRAALTAYVHSRENANK